MNFTEHSSRGAAALKVEDIFYRSHDDLVLYAVKYGGDELQGRPAVCLPGLSRNSRDFHGLAAALASHPTHPRPVYCLDYRGRGRSQWDNEWRNYSVYTEMLDVISFLTLMGLDDCAIIGTSRGGIIAMMLAVTNPSAIGCAVLNDIGPVIETAGLARIMGYAGKIPVPRNWNEANATVREINKRQFTALTDDDWDTITHQIFNEEDGEPAAACDPNVGKALSEVDIAKPVPTMWEHFESLLHKPLMVLRGENSDLLSAATVEEMKARHPQMAAVTVNHEGHAPLLMDRFTQRLIADFLVGADGSWKGNMQVPQPSHKEIPLA